MQQNGFSLLYHNLFVPKKHGHAPTFSGKSYLSVPYSDLSESCTLDLYLPKEERPPLLVLIHGGGFVFNDSRSRQARLTYEFFREHGYACASINYRLADEAVYPAALSDVKAAVRFLRSKADFYGFDGDRIALWGESAGGYLAVMTAVSGENEYSSTPYIGEGDTFVSARVSAVLDFYGVHDFDKTDSDFLESGAPKWLLKAVGSYDSTNSDKSFPTRFLGKRVSTLSEKERFTLSPTERIKAQNGLALSVFLTHSDTDITVPKAQSDRLYSACKEHLSGKTEYVERHGLRHADDRFYFDDALEKALNFLNETV